MDLSIEAQLADGTWHSILSRPVAVRRRWLPLWWGGGWAELLFSQASGRKKYAPRALPPVSLPLRVSTRSYGIKFSIVTPSLQQARFLPQTMRGVLEQAGVHADYVVQDGGSTDGSAEIIGQITGEQARASTESGAETGEDVTRTAPHLSTLNPQLAQTLKPRLIAWASEPDAGQADAIRRGFAKTSGGPDDLMAWINSDDYYLPGTLAFVADYFSRHPQVDVIYGHRLLVDEASREIGRWFLPRHQTEVLRLYDFVPQETLFWRRRIWDQVGGVDPSFKFAMDWDLLLRFAAAGAQIVRVPRFLACFRIHAGQKTSAQMETVGQSEIDALRLRTFRRAISPAEIEGNSTLIRYLRRSAWLEFIWKLGIRSR